MEAVFQGRAALLPTPQDLSFYSYQTRIQSQNSTSTLEVVPVSPFCKACTTLNISVIGGLAGGCGQCERSCIQGQKGRKDNRHRS